MKSYKVVEFGKPLVKGDRCGKAFDQIINGFAEAPRPGFRGALFCADFCFVFCRLWKVFFNFFNFS